MPCRFSELVLFCCLFFGPYLSSLPSPLVPSLYTDSCSGKSSNASSSPPLGFPDFIFTSLEYVYQDVVGNATVYFV